MRRCSGGLARGARRRGECERITGGEGGPRIREEEERKLIKKINEREKEKKRRNEKENKNKNIGRGNLDILQPQSNR